VEENVSAHPKEEKKKTIRMIAEHCARIDEQILQSADVIF